MAGEEKQSADAPCAEVLLWHDSVHESQDNARLHFWRLSFSPSYDREQIFEKLRGMFKELRISSYTIYETLGDYDLLLRMWVPKELGSEEVEFHLDETLRGLKLWNINYLIGHTTRHWADTEIDPEHWPTIDDRIIAEVSEFNRSQVQGREVSRPAKIEELIKAGVLKVIPTDTRGIRFFIVFDHPRVAFNRGNRRQALNTILRICDEILEDWRSRDLAVPCPPVSIYDGAGTMTEFLVMARAPHTYFHEFVREMVIKLRQAGLDDQYDMRPYTHVIADRMFAEFAEDRPLLAERVEPEINFTEQETESLEYKASFALNVRAYLETGEQKIDDRIMHGLVRAVCGLLNSPRGGRLVIGVLETRRELERIKDKDRYLDALKEKFDYEVEPDAQADPPNALIGIEAEIGEGKNFTDPDVYQQRLGKVLVDQVKPNPWPFLRISLSKARGRSVCVIEVEPGNDWFWALSLDGKHEKFYVREAGSTRAYSGVEGDLYKRANPRD